MKFLFATDTHVSGKGPSSRKDSYVAAVKRKLQELADKARELDVEAVIHGGDLFDKPVVSTQLTGEIANIIRSSNKPWYVVPGNHDVFGYNIGTLYQTSLGLLARTGVVHILDRKHGPLMFGDISFEGQEYHKDIDHRDPALDYYVMSQAHVKVLIPHSMLLDHEYFPGVNYTNTKDLTGKTNADVILVGHYHDGFAAHTVDNTLVFNPGSMTRDEASKGNLTRIPQYLILSYDDNGFSYEIEPFQSAQKGTEIFDRSHITDKQTKNRYLEKFEKSIQDVELDAVDVKSVLQKLIDHDQTIGSVVSKEAYKRVEEAEEVLDDATNQMIGYIEKPINIWIKGIDIKGFQSHEDTTIEFTDGLNAIVGASDSGKSAILRALRFTLYNEPRGSEFIRQSASRVECTVYFSDGSSLTRSRTRTSAGSYIVRDVNGVETELKGFTNNLPIDVANVHQMPYIQLTKDLEKTLNIGYQLEAPFLIGEGASTRASIIGRLTGVNLVDAALKEVNKDVLANNRTLKAKIEEKQSLEEKLLDYQDLSMLKAKIDQLNASIKKVEELEEEKHALSSLLVSWEKCVKAIQLNKEEQDELTPILSQERNIAQAEATFRHYQSLQLQYNQWKKLDTSLKEIDQELHQLPPELHEEIANLESKCDKLQWYQQVNGAYQWIKKQEDELQKESEALPEVDIKEAHHLAVKLEELEDLRALATSLIQINNDFVDLQAQHDDAIKEIEQQENNYQSALREHGVCPTCQQVIPKGVTHGQHR